jgi:hypothetical protein
MPMLFDGKRRIGIYPVIDACGGWSKCEVGAASTRMAASVQSFARLLRWLVNRKRTAVRASDVRALCQKPARIRVCGNKLLESHRRTVGRARLGRPNTEWLVVNRSSFDRRTLVEIGN